MYLSLRRPSFLLVPLHSSVRTIPLHPLSRLPFILNLLPQFPFTFSCHIMSHLLQIFHRRAALLSINPMCSKQESSVAVFSTATGLWESESFCVSSCMLRGRLASQSVSTLAKTWWVPLVPGGVTLHSMTLDEQASNYLSETCVSVECGCFTYSWSLLYPLSRRRSMYHQNKMSQYRKMWWRKIFIG